MVSTNLRSSDVLRDEISIKHLTELLLRYEISKILVLTMCENVAAPQNARVFDKSLEEYDGWKGL